MKTGRLAKNWLACVTCPRFITQLDEVIPLGETVQTANPVQTSAFFGVKKGFRGVVVDAGNPLQHDDFPLGRALSSAG